MTQNEILAETAKSAIEKLARWIIDNDNSYLRNMAQIQRAFEVIDNLDRYAQAILERQQQEPK